MKPSSIFEKALLADNPFRIVPELSTTVWAGHEGMKKDFERIVNQSLITSPSFMAANWGDWGTGKSHCAYYFSYIENLRRIMEENHLKLPEPIALTVQVPKPLRGGESFPDLYSNIIERIGFEAIEKISQDVSKRINDCLMKQKVDRPTIQREIKQVFSEIFVIDDLTKTFLRLAGIPRSPTADERRWIWRYLHREASSSELSRLEVVGGIDSYSGLLRAITGVIRLFTYYDVRYSPIPPYSELFLWIDECETIWELKAADTFMLLSFLRDLIDSVPNNLTVFLNVSLTGGGSLRDLRALLGDAVLSRIRENINFKHLIGTDTASKYVLDLLNHPRYRPPSLKKQCPDDYYPFSKETLQAIVEKTRPLTPRRINDNCSIVLELAIHQGIIKKIDDRISKDFVEKQLPSIPPVPS